MTKTLKIRYSLIRTDSWDDMQGIPPEGATVYVIERNTLAGAPGYRRDENTISYQFRTTPGRKNMSRAACVKGWLGTTDNISRDALGYYEVIGGSSTHLHLREMRDDDGTL